MLALMLDFKFKNLRLIFFLIGSEHGVVIVEDYDRKCLFPMFLKFYHHLHPLVEVKSSFVYRLMKIITWTFLRWRLAPMNLKRKC
jgi:hypothetical protein